MRILIADDDCALASYLGSVISASGHTVTIANDLATALARLAACDVVVADQRLGQNDGLILVREAQRTPGVEVIAITAFGTVDAAVEAMGLGAWTYLTKPFSAEDLLLHIRQVEKVRALSSCAAGRGDLVGASAAMQTVYRQIDHAARSATPVLITGETGTGKELAGRAIHSRSMRSHLPYVTLNAGALPAELAESELFGHERGAFTGADQARVGRFRSAHLGTMFIDELNSLPLGLQPKLLRTLDCGEVWPVGSDRPQTVDVRLIAATNYPLEALVAAGRFRADLMYRLRVLEVRMPPLRERVEDIPLLVQAHLRRCNSPLVNHRITPDALADLLAHSWPGNVRELLNAIERARIHADADTVLPGDPDIPRSVLIRRHHVDMTVIHEDERMPYAVGKTRAGDAWAERAIRRTLAQKQGNITHTAEALEMNRAALQRLMRRFGIPAQQNAPDERQHSTKGNAAGGN